MTHSAETIETAPCFGHCRDCGRTHRLAAGSAQAHARELMRVFESSRRLDFLVPEEAADPQLSFDQLLPGERGHMFGVLECRDDRGSTVVLRAFSSLAGGIREVDGWVPPILSRDSFHNVVLPGQNLIKEMTRELQRLSPGSPQARAQVERRAAVSQDLWRKMQALYRFHNFRGESRPLKDALALGPSVNGNATSGVGECCAPKLLNHAARTGLTPVGLAEFYWGASNQSGSRKPGEFYSCCEARCQPILGFMLCGLDDGL
jgi:hypothetical protein